jgi:hypothetical protein
VLELQRQEIAELAGKIEEAIKPATAEMHDPRRHMPTAAQILSEMTVTPKGKLRHDDD